MGGKINETPAPSPTSIPTTTATPRLVPVLEPITTFSPTDFADPANDLLHDVILFTSPDENPFPSLRTDKDYIMNENGSTYLLVFNQPLLWAVAPDGTRAGSPTCLISPGCPLFAFYFPANPAEKPLFVDYQIHINNDHFKPIELPKECYAWEPDPEQSREDGSACAGFKFSPDGRYLGFFFGSNSCYRGIMIMDTQTGKIIYRRDSGGHSFQFLENGKVLIAAGHCEGGSVSLFDPETATETTLGGEGYVIWHPNGKYFIEHSHVYAGITGSIWAYDIEANQIFFKDVGVLDQVAWTPDGNNIIYQKAEIISSTQYTMTVGAWQIITVPIHGSPSVTIQDKAHNYYLCFEWSQSMCDWQGDWIPVRRFPSTPQVYRYGDGQPNSCFVYGIDCPDPAELFALDYRTGEMIPWDQFVPPSPTPTPTPSPAPISGPDLARQPVYAHPSGAYAFYVGLDGNSLWLVPKTGDPVLWVADGQNFIYIP